MTFGALALPKPVEVSPCSLVSNVWLEEMAWLFKCAALAKRVSRMDALSDLGELNLASFASRISSRMCSGFFMPVSSKMSLLFEQIGIYYVAILLTLQRDEQIGIKVTRR